MTVPLAQIDRHQLAEQQSQLAARAEQEDAVAWHPELASLASHFPSRSLFLDLETCGFAGSAIFLIGILVEREGQLVVELLLAANYAQERAILHSLWEAAAGQDVLITFNGKSFDWPMVRDRTVYHRFDPNIAAWPPRHAHCDLLHHARRRWKELPDCRLQTLEYCICGRRRNEDIPGHRIPRAYHDFVRYGDPREIELILQHNVHDLFTLLELALRVLD